MDLRAPLEERRVGDEAFGQDDVRGLGRPYQLVGGLVVAALLVLEDLRLGLQAAALAERPRVDAVELDAEVPDCVVILARRSCHVDPPPAARARLNALDFWINF